MTSKVDCDLCGAEMEHETEEMICKLCDQSLNGYDEDDAFEEDWLDF